MSRSPPSTLSEALFPRLVVAYAHDHGLVLLCVGRLVFTELKPLYRSGMLHYGSVGQGLGKMSGSGKTG